MSRRIIKVITRGKINLSLLITGRRDAMHTLDMVMASVDKADAVTVAFNRDSKLSVRFSEKSIDCIKNTAFSAASALISRFGLPGAEISVEKKLPLSGGMGGSSADAAAVFAAYAQYAGIPLDNGELISLASSIGSDVPFMLRGGFARVTGAGEQCEFFTSAKPLFLTLFYTAGGVNTASAYGKYDEINSKKTTERKNFALRISGEIINALKEGDVKSLPYLITNDLTDAAEAINPGIKEARRLTLSAGAAAAFMTGSGSTVVGLYNAEEQSVAGERLLKKYGACESAQTASSGITFI